MDTRPADGTSGKIWDMTELTQVWTDYLTVLERRAPATRASILPPKELDLASAHQALYSPLLPSMVTWFGLHGGSSPAYHGSPLPRCGLLSLDEAVEETEMIRDVWQLTHDLDKDPPTGGAAGDVMYTWMNEYVLFADNGSGGGLFHGSTSWRSEGVCALLGQG